MAEAAGPPPPRVLLVMPDQWPRALLRATLREAGYDAIGAPSLTAALRYQPHTRDRGPVGLLLVDQSALKDREATLRLGALLRRHGDPSAVLLARATTAFPLSAEAGAIRWRRTIKRPASVADLLTVIQSILPLREPAGPID